MYKLIISFIDLNCTLHSPPLSLPVKQQHMNFKAVTLSLKQPAHAPTEMHAVCHATLALNCLHVHEGLTSGIKSSIRLVLDRSLGI